jgi:hypothetical protein
LAPQRFDLRARDIMRSLLGSHRSQQRERTPVERVLFALWPHANGQRPIWLGGVDERLPHVAA